jgi:hypothetical protein
VPPIATWTDGGLKTRPLMETPAAAGKPGTGGGGGGAGGAGGGPADGGDVIGGGMGTGGRSGTVGEGVGAPPGEVDAGPSSVPAPSTESSAGGPDDVGDVADESVPAPEILASGLLDCDVGPLDEEADAVCLVDEWPHPTNTTHVTTAAAEPTLPTYPPRARRCAVTTYVRKTGSDGVDTRFRASARITADRPARTGIR